MEIIEDEENYIESVLFKLLDIPDEEEDDEEPIEGPDSRNDKDKDSHISGLDQDNEDQD